MTSAAEKIQKHREQYNRRIQEIRDNPDLNAEARQRMMLEAYNEAQKAHERLASESRKEQETNLDKLERRVFAPGMTSDATPGDKASIASSYRDALDRASKITEEEDLVSLQRRARATGDRLLERAAFYRAAELGSSTVTEAHLEAYPQERKGWEELLEVSRAASTVQPFSSENTGPEAPRELGGAA